MSLSSFSVKTLAASLVLLSTTGLAFAKHHHYKAEDYKKEAMAPCPAPVMLRDGAYAGVQVGYDSYRVRESISTSGATANPVINATGFVGGLLAGYGRYMDNFYLGGEIFVNQSGADSSFSITDATIGTYTSKFTARTAYGLGILPGVRLNDTSLGYIRLGYNWSKLKLQEPGTSKSNTSGGFNYGLGLETLLVDNWSLRTEYSHTDYNSFSTALGTNVKPADNQFMLGLLYHFA